MKTRAKLFSIFQKFHAKVRTQFNTSMCILRSNNAKEYLSGPFSSFMSSHEILHQSSCVYTPQHNGVVERKNRHLVETARTLLLYHKVPQRFWGDATLVTCYLINRICHHLSYMIKSLIPSFFQTNPLLPSLSYLWLCLFCPYSYSWTRQTLSQSHEVCLPRLFSTSTRLSLLFS